jgi:hypothetical protein
MKKTILSILSVVICGLTNNAQDTNYVDTAATFNNDGTS